MSVSGENRPTLPQEVPPPTIFGMPRNSFWLTVFLGLVLYVSSVTDVPDEVRFW